MHPRHHAHEVPDRPAIIMAGSSETISYAALDARANQVAQLLRARGLRPGDCIAACLDQSPVVFDLAWGAQRAGLYFTCISNKLSAQEVAYIINDSGAKLFITTFHLAELAEAVAPLVTGTSLLMSDGVIAPYIAYEAAVAEQPTTLIADPAAGGVMLYSSGTTGQPKGVKPLLPDLPFDAPSPLAMLAAGLYGISAATRYLSPAPLYHAAPLNWSMAVQRLGGTVVVMERFEAENALAMIDKYHITHAQWVPTHFVRMLKLPAEVRARYDCSSLQSVFHAAAPCPIAVKQAMIDWWGPIVHEYYAGTEGTGLTAISAAEWLQKKGSVGRAVIGKLRICDESGEPLPANSEGLVYFESDLQFEYHNAPEKTAEARNRHGWTTLGDIGYVDAEGYLFLTDRKAFMIISGGVNIYPQEVENLLVTHPKVADVAVIGAPDDEMGEQVVAVVQPLDWADATEGFAAELIDFARAHISHVKAPRRIDFMAELPRHATGKLYKRLLRNAYWAQQGG